MDVRSSLFVIFITQCSLHAVSAKLQVEDIVSTLDDIIQARLQERPTKYKINSNLWHTGSAMKLNNMLWENNVFFCVLYWQKDVVNMKLYTVNKEEYLLLPRLAV